MTSTHSDELARLLGGQASARSSAQLTSLREGPTVTVAGYGELQLPLTAARAKRLLTFGKPAPYGKAGHGGVVRRIAPRPSLLVTRGERPRGAEVSEPD